MDDATTGDGTIDEQRFGELAADFGPEIVRELVASFLDTTPPIIARLREAAAAGDHDEVVESGHRLKGGCLAVGAGALCELAAHLERLGRERVDSGELRAEAARLVPTWTATGAALRARTDALADG